jgi:hypothetical protein
MKNKKYHTVGTVPKSNLKIWVQVLQYSILNFTKSSTKMRFGLWCLTPVSTLFQLWWRPVLLVEETRENHRPHKNKLLLYFYYVVNVYVGGFLWFPPPIKLAVTITEIVLKLALNTINQTSFLWRILWNLLKKNILFLFSILI